MVRVGIIGCGNIGEADHWLAAQTSVMPTIGWLREHR